MPTLSLTNERAEELRTEFQLSDGKLFKRKGSGWKRVKEKRSVNSGGYKLIFFNGRSMLYHRLVYFLHTGEWPKYVDHIDRNKINNHPSNLRAVTARTNSSNRKNKTSSGFTGVYRNSDNGGWRAMVAFMEEGERKQICLGTFSTPEDAYDARRAWIKQRKETP